MLIVYLRGLTITNAKAIGLDVMKEWNCAWVNTRQWHAELEGVRIEENEVFPNGPMYPGDPGGTAAEAYNCQCYLAGAFKDSPKFSDKTRKSYEKWYLDKLREAGLNDKKITYGKKSNSYNNFNYNLQIFGEEALKKQNEAQLKKGIRNLEKRLQEHIDYVADPHIKVETWDNMKKEEQERLLKHWEKEIKNFKESIENRKSELKEREK